MIPILTDNRTVAELATALKDEPLIAVDLEADSLHSYNEKVCLLQVSTPRETVLIDPLAADDLSPLGEVLAAAAITKIFHAADYDIRCLHRDFGFEVRGLFDTMVSSQFLGEEKVGLADMLGKYLGVELDKQYQRADWSQRPLSAEMQAYAAADTAHLHRLHALLVERLQAKGRLDWVLEEFALLEQGRFQEHDGPLFLRIKGAGKLDRRQLAMLEELLQWRDAEARRRDCPTFKVLGNKTLLAVARRGPEDHAALKQVEELFPRQADRYGRQLLQAVAAGRALPTADLPVFPRGERRVKDPVAEKRFKQLKAWRQEKAAELEMEPGIVINNALLEELARTPPAQPGDFDRFAIMRQWQKRELGGDILRVLG